MSAALDGNTDVAIELLKAKADINVEDDVRDGLSG